MWMLTLAKAVGTGNEFQGTNGEFQGSPANFWMNSETSSVEVTLTLPAAGQITL